MRILILVSALILSAHLPAGAQLVHASDSSDLKTSFFYRTHLGAFYEAERAIGIVPRLQAFSHFNTGLAIGIDEFVVGEYGGAGWFMAAGTDLNPQTGDMAPFACGWVHAFAFIMGFNAGATLQWYPIDDRFEPVLRPEIGIGFYRVFLNYGYMTRNLPLSGRGRHFLTISAFVPLFPRQVKGPAVYAMPQH